MTRKDLKQLDDIFAKYPAIKLVYFFGSKATGAGGPMSDYDFAVYLDEKNKKKMADIRFSLIAELSCFLKTDRVDVIILNLAENAELKYNIIKYGKLIFEKEPFQILIEPKILNEYFDFYQLLLRHGLTKAAQIL